MGNHDYWYGFRLPSPIPKWMSKEEVNHQNWTHSQIGKKFLSVVRNWNFEIKLNLGGKFNILFQHYALNEEKNWFKPIEKEPTPNKLDSLFDQLNADMIFYGHQHLESDLKGKTQYINLGSSGCNDKLLARIGILEYKNGSLELTKGSLIYNDTELLQQFELRKVPAR